MDSSKRYAVVSIGGESPRYEVEDGVLVEYKLSAARTARYGIAATRPNLTPYIIEYATATRLRASNASCGEIKAHRIKRLELTDVAPTDYAPSLLAAGHFSLACEIVRRAVTDADRLLCTGLVVNGRPVHEHPGWRHYKVPGYRSPSYAAELLLCFVDGSLDYWLDLTDTGISLDAVRERLGLPLRDDIVEEIRELAWLTTTRTARENTPRDQWPLCYRAPGENNDC